MKAKKDNFQSEAIDPTEGDESLAEIDAFNPENLSEFDSIDDTFDHDDLQLDEDTISEIPTPQLDSGMEEFNDMNFNDSTPKGSKGPGLVGFIKENWLYSSIGVIVVAVAGYIIMGEFSPAPSAPPITASAASTSAFPAPTAAQTAQIDSNNQPPTATPVTAAASKPTAPLPPTPPTITMTQTQLDQLVDQFSGNVQKSMQSIQDQIQESGSEATNQKLSNVQVQISNLNHTVKNLNATLVTTNKRLKTTQTELNTVLAQSSVDQEQLTLRATVPGRAWLVNANGDTISVTVGSSLGNIGIVTQIDSKNSTVTTSSGYVFK